MGGRKLPRPQSLVQLTLHPVLLIQLVHNVAYDLRRQVNTLGGGAHWREALLPVHLLGYLYGVVPRGRLGHLRHLVLLLRHRHVGRAASKCGWCLLHGRSRWLPPASVALTAAAQTPLRVRSAHGEFVGGLAGGNWGRSRPLSAAGLSTSRRGSWLTWGKVGRSRYATRWQGVWRVIWRVSAAALLPPVQLSDVLHQHLRNVAHAEFPVVAVTAARVAHDPILRWYVG